MPNITTFKTTLTHHETKIHGKETQFKCQQCSYTAGSNGYLDIHVKQINLKMHDKKC
jgi:hypothetical protein